MPWIKITDSFRDDPDLRDMSHGAAILFVCSLAHCAAHGTDGFVSLGAAKHLVGWSKKAARELVAAGWWIEKNDGFFAKNYTKYNPTDEEISEKKASNRDRQKRWREAHRNDETGRFDGGDKTDPETPEHNAVTNGVSNAEHNALRNASCNATPVPSRPVTTTNSTAPVHVARGGAGKPTIEAITRYFQTKGLSPRQAQAFFDHWDREDWRLSNGERIAKWSYFADQWIADPPEAATLPKAATAPTPEDFDLIR